MIVSKHKPTVHRPCGRSPGDRSVRAVITTYSPPTLPTEHTADMGSCLMVCLMIPDRAEPMPGALDFVIHRRGPSQELAFFGSWGRSWGHRLGHYPRRPCKSDLGSRGRFHGGADPADGLRCLGAAARAAGLYRDNRDLRPSKLSVTRSTW